jgi:hypothetical protein
MSEATTGAVILAALIFVISTLLHWRFRSIILPSLAAALLAATAFLLIDTAHRGHLDPFGPIAFIISFLWALGGAVSVGIVFAGVRKHMRENP